MTNAPGGGQASVSWYTDIDGTAVRWIDLDPQTRQQAAEDIKAAVAALEPVLHDPSLGPSVQRALNVADLPRDLLLVGGKPVLTNWGLLPVEIAGDEGRRQVHWERGLGSILAWSAPPPFADADPEMVPFGPSSTDVSSNVGVSPEAHVEAAGSTQAAVPFPTPTRMTVGRTLPNWIWPAAASGVVLLAILLLLFVPRLGLLSTAFRNGGIEDQFAALEQRATLLRTGLASDFCTEPARP
ncbi:hypothetical protein [Aureimonas psammosilenae]|uniref:hypothetical protein n=1 Tax=Aureimonas psammosilenae TaxID=2495496 RepID=UPI00126109A8|nr:hypothetical protein [Aureimonas psammosilenae]